MYRKTILSLSLIMGAAASNVFAADWSYEGDTGPEHWAELSEEFVACGAGLEQSPIDLGGYVEGDDSLKKLKHKFRPSDLTVVNNGHTVVVNVDNGSFTKTENGRQPLLQYHFHAPSENTLNGVAYPLEVHFVHLTEAGKISVVGVFYEEGEENESLGRILDVAPEHIGEASVSGEKIDGNDVLGGKKTKEYYRFAGSLTTPPCTEGVNWYVSKDIQTASAEQIEAFSHLFHGNNARPIQPINTRVLRERSKKDD